MPSAIDILAYGGRGALTRELEAERAAEQRERLALLLEQQELAPGAQGQTPVGSEGRFTADLPQMQFGAPEQVELLRTLNAAGYSTGDLSNVRQSAVDAARAKLFEPTYQGLGPAQRADFVNDMTVAPIDAAGGMTFNRYDPQGAILDESSAVAAQARQREAAALFQETQTGALTGALSQIQDPARLAEVASGRSIAPVKASGGVLYSPYNEADPLLAESSAVSGLGSLRAAQASGENTRNDVLGEVFEAPGVSPLVAADVANRNTVSKPERVAIRGKNGTTTYANAIRTPAGGYRYMEATDEAGAPVQPPPEGATGSATALQKDTAFIAETLNLPADEALRTKLQLKQKTPARAWEDIVTRVLTLDYGKYARDPAQLRAKAAEIWSVARPNDAVPDLPVPGESAATSQAAASGASASQASGNSNDLASRARQEGHTNLGRVLGDKVEVLDAQGNLIGHFY